MAVGTLEHWKKGKREELFFAASLSKSKTFKKTQVILSVCFWQIFTGPLMKYRRKNFHRIPRLN